MHGGRVIDVRRRADDGAHKLPLAPVALTSPVQTGQDASITGLRAGGSFPAKEGGSQGDRFVAWRGSPADARGNWPLIVHCTDSFKGSVQQRRLEISFTVR
jgi:hypothetical protein